MVGSLARRRTSRRVRWWQRAPSPFQEIYERARDETLRELNGGDETMGRDHTAAFSAIRHADQEREKDRRQWALEEARLIHNDDLGGASPEKVLGTAEKLLRFIEDGETG